MGVILYICTMVKRLRDCTKHSENPFHDTSAESLMVKRFPVEVRGDVVNTITGEIIQAPLYIKKNYGYKDNTASTKVYKSFIPAFNQLTVPGLKLLFFIMYSVKRDQDDFYLSQKDALVFCGYKSTKELYKGIIDLINHDIVAKGDRVNIYYINPNAIFSGNKGSLIDNK